MALEIYLADDTTLADALVFEAPGGGAVEAGQDSAAIELHLWSSIGEPGAEVARGVTLELQTLVGAAWVGSGVAPQDELWGRARVIGQNNTSHPEQSIAATDWVPLGAYAAIDIGDVYGNCAVHLEVKLHPASTAAAAGWSVRLLPVSEGHARPVPPALTAAGGGILPGVGQFGVSCLVRGGAVTATGTPDDEVHVAALYAVRQGLPMGWVAADLTLNQQDGAAAALVAGQSYVAAITVGPAGPRATKGLKGAAPVRPTPPAGDVLLTWAEVAYQAGGTSVVAPADLTPAPAYHRHQARITTGTSFEIGPGRVLFAGADRSWSSWLEVTAPASSTRYLYQDGQGQWVLSASAVPASAGEFGPLWRVETNATDVTALVDLRTYTGRAVVLSLDRHAWVPAVAAVAARRVEVDRAWIEVPTLRLSAAGGTVTNWLFDVQLNGVSIYTSSATDDQRPTLAAGATGTGLVHTGGVPEVLELRRGDLITLTCLAIPTGPPATVDVECALLVREG